MMEEVFVNASSYNFMGYEDGVDNATEENSSVFSLIWMEL